MSKRDRRESRRNRRDDPRPRPAAEEDDAPRGLLTSMRGGIKDVAGTGPEKPKSPARKIVDFLLWLLVAAAVVFFVLGRFGGR